MTIIRKDLRDEGGRSERYAGGGWSTAPFFNNREAAEEDMSCWRPAVDVLEEKEAIKLLVELPGLDKSDIAVNIDNGILSISGKRQAPGDAERAKFLRTERCFGSFCRSFSIGNQIDVEKIDATMDKGMLTLVLPFREESKPKSIEVKIGG